MTKKLIVAFALLTTLAIARRAEAVCQTYQYCDYDYYYWNYYCYDYTYDGETGQYGCTVGSTATKFAIYLHGRGADVIPTAGRASGLPGDWGVVAPQYDGKEALASGATTTVYNTLRDYCTGARSCVVITVSAGYNRFLWALSLLRADNYWPNILYVSSVAPPTGGSEVATNTTKGFYGLLSRITGHQADLDSDLRHYYWAQGGAYSHLHNQMDMPAYLTGNGQQDECIKVKVIGGLYKYKVCGNKNFPGRAGDGAVAAYSACGYSDQGVRNNCCEGGYKWQNHNFDGYGSCNYPSLNHGGAIKVGLGVANTRLQGWNQTMSNSAEAIPAGGSEPECNPAYWDCDMAEANGMTYFYVYEGFQNSVYSDVRSYTCGACNVYGIGDVLDSGVQYYDNYYDYDCQYYFNCYSYEQYYWTVRMSWGQTMTCYSWYSNGDYPSCY